MLAFFLGHLDTAGDNSPAGLHSHLNNVLSTAGQREQILRISTVLDIGPFPLDGIKVAFVYQLIDCPANGNPTHIEL